MGYLIVQVFSGHNSSAYRLMVLKCQQDRQRGIWPVKVSKDIETGSGSGTVCMYRWMLKDVGETFMINKGARKVSANCCSNLFGNLLLIKKKFYDNHTFGFCGLKIVMMGLGIVIIDSKCSYY